MTHLHHCVVLCRSEAFHELRGMAPENLMYIKEDLIIPHVRPVPDPLISCTCRLEWIAADLVLSGQHYTFYDLIIAKARGRPRTRFVVI